MKKFCIFAAILFLLVSSCLAQTGDQKNLKKVAWIFSEKDFNLKIDEEKIAKGNHKSEISRQASTEPNKLLIKKAEALYPENSDSSKNGNYKPIDEENPYWSASTFDGIKIASVISTRAIQYYKEISQEFRDGKKVTEINMSATDFSYNAEVQHYDKYEIADEKFSDVSVVKLKIEWSQYCGSLCAMGYNIGKTVVFSKDGEPIAVYIENGWVMVS